MKKNNSKSTKTMSESGNGRTGNQIVNKPTITSAERVLAVLFGFGFILGFLLTPLGVELVHANLIVESKK